MDYYKILGIAYGASKEDIKKAFRDKAKEFHPDKPTGNEAKYKEITEAYSALISGAVSDNIQVKRDPFSQYSRFQKEKDDRKRKEDQTASIIRAQRGLEIITRIKALRQGIEDAEKVVLELLKTLESL